MASNNNDDPRKKQKKTEVVEQVDQVSSKDTLLLPLSLSAPVVVVVPPALSFGTILHEFPDFFSCVLPYIADRVIWNSIASSNKDVLEKSKAILPPWPEYYKLPVGDFCCWSWSPCGTRIACSVHNTNIEIFDQRRGLLRRWQHIPDDDHVITDLKFSPDGSYFVSAGDDGFIRFWDNVAGNYEQLQEWNMKEEFAEEFNAVPIFCISACSKYIAVSLGTFTFLKDVENGKTIKSLMPLAQERNITESVFSSDGRAIFICCDEMFQVWRPYLDDDDEDCVITLWRRKDYTYYRYTLSRNKTMIVIGSWYKKERTLWSIDMNHNCLTQKLDLSGSIHDRVHFTPGDKYIVCDTENEPKLWSIAEGKCTNKAIHFLDNGSNTNYNLAVASLSPNNRQCIVRDPGTGNLYITSYFVK